MHSIVEKMIPALIPNPSQDERDTMICYYDFYLRHKQRLQDDIMRELSTHPFWNAIINAIPKDVQEEQTKQSEIYQKKAIYENDWEPWVINGIQQGITYASMGIGFATWFELLSMHRKHVTILLIQDQEEKGLDILNGLNTYCDLAMGIIGEAYLAEKKSIVEQQKKEQELLNKELEQFIYIATHDLKEPLNTASSFIDMLNKKYGDKLDGTAKTYLTSINQSVSIMKDLVKDLMEYSIIGSEKVLENVDFNEMLKEVVTGMRASIENSKADLKIENLPTIEVYPKEIKMLFQNLISNAIKFSRDGIPPKIVIRSEQQNGHWKFTVKDNGLGIDKKYHEKIFVLFQRLHPRTKYEGTGIGLAHCKKIIELHKGEIWVDSVPDEGSEFHFTINVKK